MRLDAIEPGDVVLVQKGGAFPFEAEVIEKAPHELRIEPLKSWPTWRTARPREILRRIWPEKRHRRTASSGRSRAQTTSPTVAGVGCQSPRPEDAAGERAAQLALYPTSRRDLVALPIESKAAAPG